MQRSDDWFEWLLWSIGRMPEHFEQQDLPLLDSDLIVDGGQLQWWRKRGEMMLLVRWDATFWNTVKHQLLSCGFVLAKSVLKEKRLELKPSGWTRTWKELQKRWTEQHWLNVSLTVLSTHKSLRHLSHDEAFADVAFLFSPASAAMSQYFCMQRESDL